MGATGDPTTKALQGHGDVTTREFTLPDLGEGLEEAEIVSWLVDVGDAVELNQEIVEVETAKAVIAVPCPYAGMLVDRFGEAGAVLAVGAPLCRVETADTQPAGTGVPEADGEAPASSGLDAADEPQPLVGYGQRERTSRRRPSVGGAAPGQTAIEMPATGSLAVLAKPPVRKLARDLGVDLAALAPGSGPDGTVTRADVQAAAGTREAPAPPRLAARAVSSESALRPTGSVVGFRGRSPGGVEKVTGIRKRIVAKMEQSRREIPHALCSVEADVTELWGLRTVLTEEARSDELDVKVTPFALVCRAVVLGLRRFPTLNARYDAEAGNVSLLEPIHLGVAVDTERGLMVPNIGDAHEKSTLQLAAETARLAAACRDGSVTPAELTGGTFTVNNYGFFGSDDGNPIINHPEAAILGVGVMREKPWVHQGEIVVRRTARLTLAFDHRVCDGGEAGRFVTYVAGLCEQPARILLHA